MVCMGCVVCVVCMGCVVCVVCMVCGVCGVYGVKGVQGGVRYEGLRCLEIRRCRAIQAGRMHLQEEGVGVPGCEGLQS